MEQLQPDQQMALVAGSMIVTCVLLLCISKRYRDGTSMMFRLVNRPCELQSNTRCQRLQT